MSANVTLVPIGAVLCVIGLAMLESSHRTGSTILKNFGFNIGSTSTRIILTAGDGLGGDKKAKPNRVRLAIVVIGFLTAVPITGYGQTTLRELSDFAGSVCERAPMEGKSSESELSAEAKTDLLGFLKPLGLSFDARASRKDSSFSGVQQDKLADALAKGNECRSAVVHDFRDLVLHAPTPAPQDVTNAMPMQRKNAISPHTNAAPCSPMPSELAPMLQNSTRELRSLPAPNLPSVVQPKTVAIALGEQQAVWPGVFVAMQRIPQFSEQPMIMVLGVKMKAVVGFCEAGQQIQFSPAPSRNIIGHIDEVTVTDVTITFREDR